MLAGEKLWLEERMPVEKFHPESMHLALLNLLHEIFNQGTLFTRHYFHKS